MGGIVIVIVVAVAAQIFNEINARKLGGQELNVFAGIHRNPIFVTIWVGTLIVQVRVLRIQYVP